jgi:hypothetical protein
VPLNVSRTVLPAVETLFRPDVHSVCCGCSGIFSVRNVNLKSAAVSALPSLHLTPGRTVIAYTFFVTQVPFEASQGMNLSLSGSYRNGVSYARPTVPVT